MFLDQTAGQRQAAGAQCLLRQPAAGARRARSARCGPAP
jgi:hypothetical protein